MARSLRTMLTAVCVLLVALGTSLLGAGTASANTTQPPCVVDTTNGSTTASPKSGIGYGPLELMADGEYADSKNLTPIGADWDSITNTKAVNISQYTGRITTTTIKINLIQVNNPSGDNGKTTSPSYAVHGTINKTWKDTGGGGHTLTKGDFVSWTLHVNYIGGDSLSGSTKGTCVL